MGKKTSGYGWYVVKVLISLGAIFILLLVNSPLSIFYFPVLAKACVTIDILIIAIWMVLLMAFGEVFARKRGNRIEAIIISDNGVTLSLAMNVAVFAVILLMVAGVVIQSGTSTAGFDIFLQLGHAIYFAVVLSIVYVILRPTRIDVDGNTVRITPSLAMRYGASDKLKIPYLSIHYLVGPIADFISRSPTKVQKTIEIAIENFQMVPMEKNLAGNIKPLLIITDSSAEERKVYIVLDSDKSLNALKGVLAEYLKNS